MVAGMDDTHKPVVDGRAPISLRVKQSVALFLFIEYGGHIETYPLAGTILDTTPSNHYHTVLWGNNT